MYRLQSFYGCLPFCLPNHSLRYQIRLKGSFHIDKIPFNCNKTSSDNNSYYLFSFYILKSRYRPFIEGKRRKEKLSCEAYNVNHNISFIHEPAMLLFLTKKIWMYVLIVMERRYDSSILQHSFTKKYSM